MEQTSEFRSNHAGRFAEKLEQTLKSKGSVYACSTSKFRLQQASDHFQRANRDLGEVAALIGASLTTVTAVEAVINIAVDRIGLSKEILQMSFDGYIAFLIAMLFLGSLRFMSILNRRARAEKEMDQAKKEIYIHCGEVPKE